jgi:hypothetical protein
VKDLLVLRVRKAPDAAQLEAVNADFGDLVDSGRIEVSSALPEEEGEDPRFPRVTLRFHRRDMGRLRLLVDRLNTLVRAEASPPREASPHEIVAEGGAEED